MPNTDFTNTPDAQVPSENPKSPAIIFWVFVSLVGFWLPSLAAGFLLSPMAGVATAGLILVAIAFVLIRKSKK